MSDAGPSPEIEAKYGSGAKEVPLKDLLKDSPTLCGQTCAWLTTGAGLELRGLYLDSRQDQTKLLELGRQKLWNEKRNVLGVRFLDGYCNEP
jgi:hypothetical protein